jgi:hypothetical protein
VKVRGYRVEPAEIETAVLELDGVQEAAVLAGKERDGEDTLVAYVVPAGIRGHAPAFNISVLRRALAEKVPEHMVPARFVILDRLPLTPGGKVDRLALPSPDAARPDLNTPFAPPRTPIEEALVAIWAEILELRTVGIHDSFFELGGHSLHAGQVLSRVELRWGVSLSMGVLFDALTVAGLAAAIVQHQALRPHSRELR